MSAGRLQLARLLVPAYVVHPRVETVEADAQGYHWTGCRLAEERPRVVLERERERGSGGRVAVQERRGEEHRSGQELREPQSRGRVRAPAALLPVQLCAPFPQVRILPCTLVSETQRPPSGTRVNAHSFSPFVHSKEV